MSAKRYMNLPCCAVSQFVKKTQKSVDLILDPMWEKQQDRKFFMHMSISFLDETGKLSCHLQKQIEGYAS